MGSPSLAITAEGLADRIEADLRSQGLKPGDRYLTSEQARAKFAVRKGLINRSMQMLANRNVLVRQRRAGTFVGPGFDAAASQLETDSDLRTVHVLMAMDYYRTRIIPAEKFVEATSRVLPRAVVQIHYVPENTAVEHVREVVEGVAGEANHGLILIRTPREGQLLVEQSGVPAIVFGSVYPDVRLPSLDVDQVGAARLGVQFAVARGRQKFLLIMRDQWRQGDNLLLRGVTQELAASGVGLDSVEVASVPPQRQVIVEEVRARLRDASSLVILCRGTFAARPALGALSAAGIKPGDGVDVVNLQGSIEERPCCPTVVPDWSYEEQITALVRELADAARAEGKPPRTIDVPVSLVDEQGRPVRWLGKQADPDRARVAEETRR